jgi:hypothetical protein
MDGPTDVTFSPCGADHLRVVRVHLHPNSLLALAIFQHFCKAFVGVHPSVSLFLFFYVVHPDVSSAISDSLIFRLCPVMVICYITVC